MKRQEHLLYPPTVVRYENDEPVEVPYSEYQRTVETKTAGDILVHEVSAPGIGRIEYRITRIDSTGVYAVRTRSSIRNL